MVIRLDEDTFRAIESLSNESCPHEAIGLLAGDADGTVKLILPLRNIAPLGSFLADAYEQFQAEISIKNAGYRLIAIFHSHPWGGASLSQEDLYYAANWPSCAHAVFAFDPQENDKQELRAFTVNESVIQEVPILINKEVTVPQN